MKNRIEVQTATLAPLWPRMSAIMLLAFAGLVQAEFYALTDLGALGGTNCIAHGINNNEQVVGAAQTETGDFHAFMFAGGRMMDLGTMGGSNSWAYGVNDNGWVVGVSHLPGTNMHAFLCTNALADPAMMDLGTMGGSNSAAWMINLHGDIVGWAALTNGAHHAFFLTNGMPFRMIDLGTAGGTNSAAYCINSNRTVVGYAMMTDGTFEPIMSTNPMTGSSGMKGMGMGGMGAVGGQSWFVNGAGQTAGQAELSQGNHHAFVSTSGGMMGRMNVDLGTLGGSNSIAYCLNDGGVAVGTAQTSNGTMHAFMVTNAFGGMTGMMDLNDLIPANTGWELMEARSINDRGQIVGWGMHGGHTNSFLLTPVSAPVTMMTAPTSQIAGPGAMITWEMGMNASEPLTYQWLRDGMPIPDATNSSYTVRGMTTDDVGRYICTARNSVGMVAMATAVMSMFSLHTTNGVPQLVIAAPEGSHFRIDRSDLLGPAANWEVMTNFTVMGSMVQLSDTSSAGSPARFYRTVMAP